MSNGTTFIKGQGETATKAQKLQNSPKDYSL